MQYHWCSFFVCCVVLVFQYSLLSQSLTCSFLFVLSPVLSVCLIFLRFPYWACAVFVSLSLSPSLFPICLSPLILSFLRCGLCGLFSLLPFLFYFPLFRVRSFLLLILFVFFCLLFLSSVSSSHHHSWCSCLRHIIFISTIMFNSIMIIRKSCNMCKTCSCLLFGSACTSTFSVWVSHTQREGEHARFHAYATSSFPRVSLGNASCNSNCGLEMQGPHTGNKCRSRANPPKTHLSSFLNQSIKALAMLCTAWTCAIGIKFSTWADELATSGTMRDPSNAKKQSHETWNKNSTEIEFESIGND